MTSTHGSECGARSYSNLHRESQRLKNTDTAQTGLKTNTNEKIQNQRGVGQLLSQRPDRPASPCRDLSGATDR